MTAQQQRRPPIPSAPPVVVETIPAYFTRRHQWVTWRYEHDGERLDKLKKVPYNPRRERRARSNDRSTWYTFRSAVQAYRSRGDSGVAYMLDGQPGHEGDVGIDLDGCREPATGAIAPWAQPWLERLTPLGYAEVSSEAEAMFWARRRAEEDEAASAGVEGGGE